MYPWQTEIIGKMKDSEVQVICTGRNTGKSALREQWLDDYTRYIERAAWCTQQWSKQSRETWWYEDGEFKFANAQDEVLFRLRWD